MNPIPVKLSIQMNESDIEHGIGNDCKRCPIARAIERTLGGTEELKGKHSGVIVEVMRTSVFIRVLMDGVEWLMPVDLPHHAREFVREFDSGFPVRPIALTLEGKLEPVAYPTRLS